MGSDQRVIDVPFIPGDGVGPEIMAATQLVVDSAVRRSYSGDVSIRWIELQAGESSFRSRGDWMPAETVEAIRRAGVAIKGPLTTPVGGGIRSLNVALRQMLELYASVRPVRYIEGVPSPVKEPHKVDLVIFRENTEDVYKGLEWRHDSEDARKVRKFLIDAFGISLSDDTGIGLKPMSESASKRLVRAAFRYALANERRVVTLVHKGNIMKFTEGAFRDWGYEVAEEEGFRGMVVREGAPGQEGSSGKVVLNDRIADNMFQQVLTRPSEYSVIATPNLNGDYLADACAAQVGGLGFAPGANIGDGIAVFEPVHGTAPKYAGKDIANPCALMLSGAMMLEHLGMKDASRGLVRAIGDAVADGVVTQDVARVSGARPVGTDRFALEVSHRI